MTSEKTCPKCKGKKIIVGNCECNPEWRSSDGGDQYDDCQCEPDIDCPQCQGKGYIE
ncbi:MAG: ankyrin [Desulfobacula sp.]|nr:ankyrin [Desulfobacula sp.]